MQCSSRYWRHNALFGTDAPRLEAQLHGWAFISARFTGGEGATRRSCQSVASTFSRPFSFVKSNICPHNQLVPLPTGALINAIGILLGAFIGLTWRKAPSLRTQLSFRNVIGAFTVFLGARLIYMSIGGPFWPCMKEILIMLLSVIFGFWIGKLFRLQKLSNYLGRLAGNAIAAAQRDPNLRSSDAFNACAILFCAAPLGIIGAVTDGLSGYFYFLAVKAAMDALAMLGFVKIFNWPAALSAIPVLVFFSAVALGVQLCVKPYIAPAGLDSICAAAGLVACLITIVIFEVRRVELANFLPALAIAPLLTKLWG